MSAAGTAQYEDMDMQRASSNFIKLFQQNSALVLGKQYVVW